MFFSSDLWIVGAFFSLLGKKKSYWYFLKTVTLLTYCNYTILDTYQEMNSQNRW